MLQWRKFYAESKEMSVSPQNLTYHSESSIQENNLNIGVLALQGDFTEHINMLRHLGSHGHEVRLPEELTSCDALIIPGGESTTIGRLATQFGLIEPLRHYVTTRKPVWGTCAGMIFLAKTIGSTGSGGHVVPPHLAVMDITVNRNAFGRQVNSFEADLSLSFDEATPFRAIFIRAPRIEAYAPQVEILATLPDGTPVAARQDNLLVTAFHPELTNDLRLHQYFLTMISPQAEVQP